MDSGGDGLSETNFENSTPAQFVLVGIENVGLFLGPKGSLGKIL